MKKILIALLLIGGAYYGYHVYTLQKIEAERKLAEQSRHQTTSKIVDIVQVVDAAGFTSAMVQTDVKSEIKGRVEKLFVVEGQKVELNQQLLRLDTRSLEAELDEARKRLETQVFRLEKNKRDWERLENLSKNNFARESEFQDAKTNYEIAKLELDIQKARVESTLDKLSKALLLAPNKGTVINLVVNEGQVISGADSVSGGNLLMQIADVTRLKVDIDLSEVDVNKVKVGDKADLRFDAIDGEKFSGTITAVTTSAIVKSNARIFPTTVTIDKTDARIKPGISANISLRLQSAKGVVGVVLSAVFIGENKEQSEPERFVYIVKPNGETEKRVVTTGISDRRHIEIKTGLEAGEVLQMLRPSGINIDKGQKSPSSGGSGGNSQVSGKKL